MNNNDQFEQRLHRQTLRPVPPAWREEILAQAHVAADANRPKIAEDRAALFAGWRLLFRRLPLAWTSLAALWIVLVGVNLTMPGPFVSVAVPTQPLVRLESLSALDFSRAQFQPLADELMPAPVVSPAPQQPAAPRRPRSDRRRDSDTRAACSKYPWDTIV